MASSGSFNTSSCEGRYLTFSWSISSQSVANNTSTISWKLVGAGCSGYVVVSECHVTINGVSVYNVSSSTHVNCYVGTVIASGTQTIAHNTDGNKSFSASVSAGIYQWAANCSGSGSWALTTIPRASSLTLPSSTLTMGTTYSFSISSASSGFSHDVVLTFGGQYFYIGQGMGQGSFSWAPWIDKLASKIPDSVSGSGTLTLHTFNCFATDLSSRTLIGSKSYPVTLNLPSSVVPSVGTITLTPTTINGKNILVQGKNKLTISVSGCSAGTGSSIKSYTFSGPGISSTTTSTSVSGGPISSTGTLTYTVTVTDNRGRAASKSATITCYAYSAPYFSSFSAYRSNSSGTADNNGSYIKCSYSLFYASVNSTNDVTVKIMYKKNSATSYSSVTSLADSTATSGSQILSSIALDSTYTVYATITDNYSGSSSSQTITIFGASRVLNVLKSGEGVAFGKMAESEKLFDVKWPIKSGDPINTLQNFSYRGSNLISSTANDTIENWNNQGNLATTFYTKTGQINGQPCQYGFLLNLTTGPGGQEAHQLWLSQNNGDMSHRGGNSSGMATSWKTCLDSSNYTSYAQQKPITLYSTSTGNIGTITLSSSAANFTYLEIFYTDNNTRQPSSIKVYSPNGKYVSLSCIEPSTSGSEPRVYIRTSGWTISGTTMTPGRSDLSGANRGVYGQIYKDAGGTNVDANVTAQNYIKIFRVLGYA